MREKYVCCARPEFSGPLLDALRAYAARHGLAAEFRLQSPEVSAPSLLSIFVAFQADRSAESSWQALRALQAYADGWRDAIYSGAVA